MQLLAPALGEPRERASDLYLKCIRDGLHGSLAAGFHDELRILARFAEQLRGNEIAARPTGVLRTWLLSRLDGLCRDGLSEPPVTTASARSSRRPATFEVSLTQRSAAIGALVRAAEPCRVAATARPPRLSAHDAVAAVMAGQRRGPLAKVAAAAAPFASEPAPTRRTWSCDLRVAPRARSQLAMAGAIVGRPARPGVSAELFAILRPGALPAPIRPLGPGPPLLELDERAIIALGLMSVRIVVRAA
jgi:hypothetical protein